MKSILVIVSLLVSVCAAWPQAISVFPRQGTVWKYNQTDDVFTATGGTGWTAYAYDDSGPSWQEGPALLSNDSGNAQIAPLIQTPILSPRATAGGTPPAQHVRYFRKKFTYSGPVGPYTILRMNERIDDAAIFWLNGTEIGRLRIPAAATLDHLTRGETLPCGGDADCENTFNIMLPTGTPLVAGDNILAVSLHQSPANSDSSDITFGISLDVIPPRAPTILSNSEPADRVILQNRSTTLRVYADASPAPTYQWHFRVLPSDPWTDILDATNSTYTIASMQQANEGYYYASVSNVITSVDSRIARVQFTTDTNAPVLVGAIAPTFTTVVVQFNEAMSPSGGVLDPFVWGISDGVNPSPGISDSIALSADGKIVTLTLLPGEALLENTLYTLTVSGVADLAGNVLDQGTADFRSYTTAGCSGFLFEAFDTANVQGNAVSILLTNANYPNNPMSVANIASFDSRHAYGDDSHNQYGGRIRGLFVPTITGPWVFYLAADDDAELFVNPSGPDSAGKIMVAHQDLINCCQNFQPQGNPRTSVPINLTAGQAYYVEGLYKEGNGGDWLKVAARPSGEPVPPYDQSTQNGSVIPVVIQGGPGPAGILNFVTIGTQPANQSVIAGQPARFSVRLSPDVPGCFQWKSNGVDITGAIGPNYNIPVTTLNENGAKYSVGVNLLGGTTLTSLEATLTVSNDVTPPSVTGVSRDLAGNLMVTFSEAVDLTGATNPANYSIDGTAPASATASGNNVIILAQGTPLSPCPLTHNITVGNIRDVYNNLITPNPSFVSLTLNDLLVLPVNASTSWRYEESGNELGDAWHATAFNDSTWSNGVPVFGPEPSANVMPPGFPIRTSVNWSPVKMSVYFRTHFDLPTDPSSVTNLELIHVIDDGAIFYINGQEVTRVRMPVGPVDTNTLASGAAEPHPLETNSIPASALVFGDNVIAARVHQSAANSSDLVFAVAVVPHVTACVAERPRLNIERSGNNVTVSLKSGPNGTIRRSSSLDGPWTAVGPAPQTLAIGPGNQFFEIRP